MGYSYKEGWWETEDGRKIKIEDMEIRHIENVIKHLKKHRRFYDICIGELYDIDTFDYEDRSYLVDKKIEELKYELKRRKNEKVLQEKIDKVKEYIKECKVHWKGNDLVEGMSIDLLNILKKDN